MAIFTRRDIQAAIYRLAEDLTPRQLDDMVKRLNGVTEKSLPAEWEAVVLSAFRECGRIIHESNDLGGITRPDMLFQFGECGSLEFLTDIRTVSNKDQHEKNPYNDFCSAIWRFLQEHGHKSNGLYIDVQHKEVGEYGQQKLLLALPLKKDLDNFVQAELGEFLLSIARNSDKNHNLSYDKNGNQFSIRYDASEKRYSGGRHISYTVPYSKRNPLTNALIDKARQLAQSGYKGSKGIIICDGGCDALNERSQVGGAFGCKVIVDGFLRTHPSILWVLVLRIDQTNNSFLQKSEITIKPALYWNPVQDKLLFQDTVAALERMVKHLPQPEATPINATHSLNRKEKVGQSFNGGFSMPKSKTIKISARTLTELLAGKIELYRFMEDHGAKPHSQNPTNFSFPFFEHQIANGYTLKSAFVEKDEHKDDDWIVLEYDGPDSAISSFRRPK